MRAMFAVGAVYDRTLFAETTKYARWQTAPTRDGLQPWISSVAAPRLEGRMLRPLLIFLIVIPLAAADSGVLIPGDRNTPDPGVLSLEEMTLNIGIDNGTARVAIREIFANHTNRNLEGTYTFALPIRSLLSDFAVWDDLTRIPGVILERKRADEIYDNLRAKTIDPGLLQMGERSADEASRSSEFTAKVTPIPSRGT